MQYKVILYTKQQFWKVLTEAFPLAYAQSVNKKLKIFY